jgi:cytochrome c553
MMPGMMSMMGGMGMGAGMGTMADAPILNGQHADYVVDQLGQFASGERQGTIMNRIAAALSPSDRKAVAAFLSVAD